MNNADDALKKVKELLRDIDGLTLDDCDELTANDVQSVKSNCEPSFYNWLMFFLAVYMSINIPKTFLE